MIQKIEPCGNVSQCKSDPGYYHPRERPRDPDLSVAQIALRKLEEAMARDTAIHEKNLPAIEANQAIADRYRAFAKEIGLPDSYNERDPKSRAMYPKMISHSAGWLSDIHRFIKTDDGFARQQTTYKELKARYDKYHEDAKKKAEFDAGSKEREREALKKKREEDMRLATIIGRYGLDLLTDWESVEYELRKKDRLLNLAMAMEETRGDWSEGCYRVRDALFVPSNEQEEAIIKDVAPLCEDFEDGRCFRDCTWSYSAIYPIIADQQLVADAKEAASHTSRY